jgi:hypothetical protein
MNKYRILIAAIFLGTALSGESAIYSADGRMIFRVDGGMAMPPSGAIEALKALGVSTRDAANLTRYITNDAKRAEEIQKLNLIAVSGAPGARRQQAAEARASSPTPTRRASSPRPKSPPAARRSHSPVRAEVDWGLLETFIGKNSENPFEALQSLNEKEPREAQRLCPAIMDPDFYNRAQAMRVRVIHSRAMVTFCEGVVFDRAQLKDIKQGARAKSPEREQVRLRPVMMPSRQAPVEEQQRGLEEVRLVLLENAEALGKREAVEGQLRGAERLLKRAQERYESLTVAISILKEDLPEGFVDFSRAHERDSVEVYTNHIAYFLDNEGRELHIDKTLRVQIVGAHDLLGQAKDNLANARYELEEVNKELLRLAK